MKTIRHLFTVLLLLCSITASAHDFEVGGIYYNITDATNKTVAVTYRGDNYSDYSSEYTGSVVIPESVTYNGTTYGVTSIGYTAFYGCAVLTSIEIPNSVTSIGYSAFGRCSLTSIVIPSSVASIAISAFRECYSLASIVVDGNNTTYDSRENCNAIIETETNTLIIGCKNTVIPNSVTSIGNSAFYECSDLTSIEIPNSVTFIGDWAFGRCSLTSIVIPSSVTFIGNDAFRDCSELTSIEIPNSVTSIGDQAFYYCSGLTSIEIPNSVTSIGNSAFQNCSGLTGIEIPNSVTFIGNDAFAFCYGLTSITSLIPADKLFAVGSYVFYNVNKNACTLYVPTGAKETYASTEGWSEFTNIVELGKPASDVYFRILSKEEKTAEIISDENKYTGDVVIPESVIYNGEEYRVTSIGAGAFEYCSGLTSVVIGNSVTSIGDWAFFDCTGLTSVVIGNSVTSIGEDAFCGCYGLTSITIPNSVTSIGDEAFFDCTGLTSVVIGNSVTSIGINAFYGCSGLTSVEIPNSVTSIGSSAFSRCTGLTSVTIPNSVTTIGNEVFSGCSRLSSITVAAGNTKYDSRDNCNAIIETATSTLVLGCNGTIIPNSVTSIGDYAFYCCTGLTSIVIPNSVTSIGNYTFNGCSALTDLCIEDGEEILYLGIGEYFVDGDNHIAVSMFQYCPLKTLYIGRNWDFAESELYNAYTAPFNHKLTSVTIGNNVTSFKNFEFFDCTGITSVTSLIPADELFAINSYVFNSVDKTTCTLYVPYGAKETYASTAGWNEFANIVELERSTFNATFYIDGEEIATSEIKAGEAVTYPDVDEREGYTLVWTPCIDVMPSEDIVIEGTFIANTYTVTYTVDGDVYATDSIAYGSEIVLRDEPAKEGYTFSGWSEAPQTMPANDIVIEGTFIANIYTVTYTVDGDVYATDSIAYGSEIVLRDEPVKDGRKFSGWSEIPSTMPAQDVVVEGKFCYTVIFMADGKYYSSSALYYGDEIIAPSETPQKEGHTFVEWGEFPETMPARDMTIHAIFSVDKYQLIFIIDGEVYETLYVEYGSEIEYPQKDGYIITWETENLPQTMPAENLIIIGTSALDTAVECVKDDNEKIVYTLDGHRILDVENLEKGVYIINGKKVLVK